MANPAANQSSDINGVVFHDTAFCVAQDMRVEDLNAMLTPGMLVCHPDRPDWGTGQVQSNIAGRVTVNFREEGKVVIDSFRIGLLPVFDG